MAAKFTRFSETILTKQDQRVVSVTVKPLVSDCTGTIYFTDLMVQAGDRLTGYVIHTETLLQKYREDGAIVPPRFYNGVVRSAETVVLFNLGSDTAGLDCYLYPVQDMAAGSVSVGLGAGAHKAVFPMALYAGDEVALIASSRERLRNGQPPVSMDFSSTAPPGTASIRSGWKIKNRQGFCSGFRKCRKAVIFYEGLSERQAVHGLVVYGKFPDVSGPAGLRRPAGYGGDFHL